MLEVVPVVGFIAGRTAPPDAEWVTGNCHGQGTARKWQF